MSIKYQIEFFLKAVETLSRPQRILPSDPKVNLSKSILPIRYSPPPDGVDMDREKPDGPPLEKSDE